MIAHFASGESIVRYEPAPPMAGTTGDIEALSMWAGQSVALARQPQSAADIVTEPLAPVNGEIRVPTRPGLGVELDPAAIERFRIDR